MLRCDKCGAPAPSELAHVKRAIEQTVPVGRVRCPSCCKTFGHISATSVTVTEGANGALILIPNHDGKPS